MDIRELRQMACHMRITAEALWPRSPICATQLNILADFLDRIVDLWKTCEKCNGRGGKWYRASGSTELGRVPCSRCGGIGLEPSEKWPGNALLLSSRELATYLFQKEKVIDELPERGPEFYERWERFMARERARMLRGECPLDDCRWVYELNGRYSSYGWCADCGRSGRDNMPG